MMPTGVVPAPGSPGICGILGGEGSFLAEPLSCRAQLNPEGLRGTFHTTTNKLQHNLLPVAERWGAARPGVCHRLDSSPMAVSNSRMDETWSNLR